MVTKLAADIVSHVFDQQRLDRHAVEHVTALLYNDVLKFMLTWTMKTMLRMVHFFHVGKQKPSSS